MVDVEGREAGVALLDDRIFGAEEHERSVHAAVRQQLSGRRSGTHATLNRTRMKGGGKKPYRQKGTGNARAGSNTSPLWYGGAVVHGPMPRSYEFKLPKKVRRQAMISVLSSRRKGGALQGQVLHSAEAQRAESAAAAPRPPGLFGRGNQRQLARF